MQGLVECPSLSFPTEGIAFDTILQEVMIQQGNGNDKDKDKVKNSILTKVIQHALYCACKQIPGGLGSYVFYTVNKSTLTLSRPNSDYICRLSMSHHAYKENICGGEDIIAYDVGRIARRILEESYPTVISTAIVIGRKLHVTSVPYANEQVTNRGLEQCRGCGSFYSKQHKGLYIHQSLSSLQACNEALMNREAQEVIAKDCLAETNPEEYARLSAIGAPKRPPVAWKEVIRRSVQGQEQGQELLKSEAKTSKHIETSSEAVSIATPNTVIIVPEVSPAAAATADRKIPIVLALARDGKLAELQKICNATSKGKHSIVTAQDRHGSGVLLWAAGGGHLHVCQWLVEELLIDPQSTPRKDGRTALHWAARNGHLDVCKYLILSCHVDANLMTFDGDSSLMLAAWQGHLKLCKWLINEAKATPHQINRWGCNAVFKAARMDGTNSSLDVLKYFIEVLAVDASIINYNGHSVLHKAAIYGREDVCRYLLEHSSMKCCNERKHIAPDKLNQSPSDMAKYNGYPQLAGYLRHHEDVLWYIPVLYTGPSSKPEIETEIGAVTEQENEM